MNTPLPAGIRGLWRRMVRRDRADAALENELRAYVDLLAAEYEAGGMTPEAARRAALVETGGIEQTKEAVRDAWAGNALATGIREVRYALRTLRRSPGFVGISVMTLGLGIGGATAVFTIIKGSLLRPLPAVAAADQLVTVERVQAGQKDSDFSYPDYRDLREGSTSLSGLAAYNGTSMALEDASGAARARVSYVSDNFFDVLGVRPAAGRFFDADVSGADATEVVVLGYDLWQQRFGGSPRAIGSSIRLEDVVFTVIGVAPPGFIGAMAPYPMEAWIPLAKGTAASAVISERVDLASRRNDWLRLVGRLAPGRDVAAAQADLAAIAARLEAAYPANRNQSVHVSAGAGMSAEERARLSRVPHLLAATVGLLLLIACGNVASLSLIRAASRRRELATRLALGASRAALVRQVSLEGIVIAAGAGLLGVLSARLLVQSTTLVETVIRLDGVDLRMDLRVLMIAVAASTLTAVIVALVPSLQILRVPAGAVLKDGGGTVRRRPVGQRVLIVSQVAASLVLLSASALVFSSFQRVLETHDRFDPRGLVDVRFEIDRAAVAAGRHQLLRSVLENAAADPTVSGAALATTIPPFEYGSRARMFRRGEEPAAAEIAAGALAAGLRVHAPRVSGEFFAVMRIPLVRGRTFTMRDDTLAEPVAIVSQRLAEALWPAHDPIGEYLAWPTPEGTPREPLRIVGVAADTRDVSLTSEAALTMYLPYTQDRGANPLLLLRGRGDAPISETTVRRIVETTHPSISVLSTRTLSDRLRDQVQPQRMASVWIGVFGLIALLLACIGLYGVVAQDVLQRKREFAVRSALGATARHIMTTVFGEGLKLAAIGAVVGGLGVVVVQPALRSFFTGVVPADMVSALAAAAVLTTAMLAAIWLPARRASRSDPFATLRQD